MNPRLEGKEKAGALSGAGTKEHMFLKAVTGQSGESTEVRGISNTRSEDCIVLDHKNVCPAQMTKFKCISVTS